MVTSYPGSNPSEHISVSLLLDAVGGVSSKTSSASISDVNLDGGLEERIVRDTGLKGWVEKKKGYRVMRTEQVGRVNSPVLHVVTRVK